MKKILILLIAVSFLLQSCATVFGGRINGCQKSKPKRDEPRRQIRPVSLVADILMGYGVGLIIDFADGAIYKPCGETIKKKDGLMPLPENTITVNGIAKNELYNRAKKWTAENFKSAKDVIQLDDKESGKIIIKGCIIYNAPPFNPGTAYSGSYFFTFSFDCKNDKYKYEFSSAFFEPYDTKAWAGDFQHKKHLKMINEKEQRELQNLALDFEEGMKSAYQANW